MFIVYEHLIYETFSAYEKKYKDKSQEDVIRMTLSALQEIAKMEPSEVDALEQKMSSEYWNDSDDDLMLAYNLVRSYKQVQKYDDVQKLTARALLALEIEYDGLSMERAMYEFVNEEV